MLLSEKPFFEAFRNAPELPYWFVSVRQSTQEEDGRKIDAIVTTVEGWEIYVQLKSSEKTAEIFRAWHARECAKEGKSSVHPHIIVLVVNKHKTPEEIRQEFLAYAEEKLKEFWRTRKK